MYDDTEDKVQCHICGKWWRHVGSHVHVSHDMSAREYKDQFGLTQKIALCATSISRTRSRIMSRAIDDGKIVYKPQTRAFYKRRKYRNGQVTMSFKNSNGLCDLQMLTRYMVVKKIVGREPSLKELQKYDSPLAGVICNRGGINKYKRSIGEETRSKARPSIPDIELIAQLRRWTHENNSRPRPTDFRVKKDGYTSYSVFCDHFGSWNNALRVAGIK